MSQLLPARFERTRRGPLWSALAVLVAICTVAMSAQAQLQQRKPNPGEPRPESVRRRGDVRRLPDDLKERLSEIAARPHSYLPLTAFSEADVPSQLIQYYLLDTTSFQPNVFTAMIPGINDNGVIATAANGANGGLPTLGAVRLVLEPKPGLPTDPEDVRAFIDMFTDLSGLFVINNESGWYEGWMIRDMRVPPMAPALPGGRPQYSTMTPEDAAAIAALGAGNNLPGRIFTVDGNPARFPAASDVFPNDVSNTVPFPVSIGAFNALQQSDVHAYWEFNAGTNWVFPHYELPFTGGVPGTFPGMQYGLQSVIPGSGPFGAVNAAATHGDNPDDPRDPDRFEPVSSGQTETRNRFIPSRLTEEVLLNVFVRLASFEPAIADVGERLLRSYAVEVARVDLDGDGALSFAEADVNGFSDNQSNTRLYFPPSAFNRFAVTREINDGLLAPRFAPSQRAYVLGGELTLVRPTVPASVPRDDDDR